MKSTKQRTGTNSHGQLELAAGGLVWFNDGASMRIAVVHRPKHEDWTLPKGKPEPGEGMEQTALREAMEETGWQTAVGAYAGAFHYRKNGTPKVVLLWHMTRLNERFAEPAPTDEIDEVAWLTPQEAQERLTHAVEKAFVARHCLGGGSPGEAVPSGARRDPKLDRLRSAVQHVREQLQAMLHRDAQLAGTWWAEAAVRSVDATEAALAEGNLDGGWGALHDAERFMIYGLGDLELIHRALALRSEVKGKLRGWRVHAAGQLLQTVPLQEWAAAGGPLDAGDRTRLEQTVVALLQLLNEHSNNTYHRMHLVEVQLQFLVKTCGALLLGTFLLGWLVQDASSPFHAGRLLSMAMAGALGGVVSAMFQLSRVGQRKIPEALLHGLITSGRPIIGAACALFVYAVLHSGLINLIEPGQVSLAAGLVLGFVAGFTERFVLNTVSRVAGNGAEGNPTVVVLSPPGEVEPAERGGKEPGSDGKSSPSKRS